MSAPGIETVSVGGQTCRVLTKGRGKKLGVLAGFGGYPKWVPMLEQLSRHFEVRVPSLPGFPGGPSHRELDTPLDWILATRDILEAAGLRDEWLVGSSIGGCLAAEVAAVWPDAVSRLALIGPMGLFDEAEPAADPWAQRSDGLAQLLCASPTVFEELRAPPADVPDRTEWLIEQSRAIEASARLLFPLGDVGLGRRLSRIRVPTLILWGENDRLMPRGYAGRFISRLTCPNECVIIPGAGHLAALDQPERCAEALAGWFRR